MIGWASGWREVTLRAAQLPVSPWALDLLSAWRKSTPVVPATNNPLGMPAKGTSNVAYLHTQYALFPSMTAFGAAFARFLGSNKGTELRGVLEAGESLSDAYRAIHALGWPANATETDYPACVLDSLEEAYRSKMATRDPAKRKTAGNAVAPPEVHAAMKQQSALLHHAAVNITGTANAIAHIMRGS